MRDGDGRARPPRRTPRAGLTLHQRRVLEAWRSAGDVTLSKLAGMFATTPSAICETLRIARAKVYGAASVPKRKKFHLKQLSVCFV